MIRKFLLLSVGMIVLGASAAYAFPPIDLTTLGATFTGTDGVIWNELITQPTGTGVYDPFLRVQANDVEHGFNTDFGSPWDPIGSHQVPLDDKAGIWTHDIKVGDLAVKNVGGIDYYVFTLDINEPNNDPARYLSLDELRLYTSGTGNKETLAQVQAGVLRYDMDAVTDQDVYLDHSLQEGSGHDDMEVLIPVSKFAGAAATDFLYLYCKFGATGGAFGADFQSGDGFEEWSAIRGTPPPPPPPGASEPTTMLLIGGGLLGMLAARRKK
jgi:hypothetical protein